MGVLLAIDPGNEQTAYALLDMDTYRPQGQEKLPNDDMRSWIESFLAEHPEAPVVIEQVGHYGTGMPAGKTVFDTCYETGRLIQIIFSRTGREPEFLLRPTIKTAICGIPRAKDSNIIQALKDRFGDKGTKKNPGWFYGFRADCWQAYAVGVAWLDGRKMSNVGKKVGEIWKGGQR